MYMDAVQRHTLCRPCQQVLIFSSPKNPTGKECAMGFSGKVRHSVVFAREIPLRLTAWAVRQRFVVGLASLVWFLYRTGLQPRRMSYPCQQAAAANAAAIFGGSAIVGLLTHRRIRPLLSRRLLLTGLGLGVFSLAAFESYQLVAQSVADRPVCLIAQDYLADKDSYPAAELPERPMYPSACEAVVAVKRNTSADYGTVSPYDKATNPVYQLVWDTVAQLGFGPADNPLRDLVASGNTVLIKPNLESTPCVHAPFVRPIVDMCLAAGAARVNIGDGSPCGSTQSNLNAMGYTDMANTLRLRGKPVYTVEFTSDAAWSWINLGASSAYTGTAYTAADLTHSAGSATPGTATYRYFHATDSHGVNPNGAVLNWNTISDYLLTADVVINVPKIRVHDALVSTFAIKNWVGVTLSCTYANLTNCDSNWCRICHWGSACPGSPNYLASFGNDFMWRDLANLHRTTLYWKDGQLRDTPQRKYLVVTDGVIGLDETQGGTHNRVGAVVASVDPIASDAVTHRLVRWNFRQLPNSNNAPSVPSHPWGTNDPARIRIVGDRLDATFNKQFTNNSYSGYPEFAAMLVSDVTPPQILSITENRLGSRLDINVETDSDAAVVFLTCGAKTFRMARNETSFTLRMLASTMDYQAVTQDRYFNGAASSVRHIDYVPNPDVNGDTKCNILDLIVIRNNLNKEPMSDDQAAVCDVNADGKVNILDLSYVRNHLNQM